jgi:hypothetical protein
MRSCRHRCRHVLMMLCFCHLHRSICSQSGVSPSRDGLEVDATIVLPTTIKLAPVATLFATFAIDVLGIESSNADSCVPPLPRVPALLPPNLAFSQHVRSWVDVVTMPPSTEPYASSPADTTSAFPLQDHHNLSSDRQPVGPHDKDAKPVCRSCCYVSPTSTTSNL